MFNFSVASLRPLITQNPNSLVGFYQENDSIDLTVISPR